MEENKLTPSTETLEAKLRNQLSPIYGLADIVLLIDKSPGLIPIAMDMAKQVISNKDRVNLLLKLIENKSDDNELLLICDGGHCENGSGYCMFCGIPL